jgi:thiamine biosynthesis lipoprotein
MPNRFILASLMIASVALASCRRDADLHLIAGTTMGTTYEVKLVMGLEGNELDLKDLNDSIQSRLDAIDFEMSPYREDSELSRFNRYHSEAPFPVSRQTAEVFAIGRDVGDLTGGALDITAGTLVNAWGFGPERLTPGIPDASTLQELLRRVDYRTIAVDLEGGSVRKRLPDVVCDLSAIAKGYGVDQVTDLLDEYGIADYMVEVGGEVRALGLNAKRVPWRIAIEKPTDRAREIEIVVPVSGYALATSGDYRNFFEHRGERFSHIIDPRTGRPIQHGLASVSVIHHECAIADAYATALLVMGPEAGMTLAEELGLKAVFISRAPESGYVTTTTKGFSAFLKEMNQQHR